jgi:hypothetical protein
MSKGTKLPSNAPEGTKQKHRGPNRNTLAPSAVLRPGASLCQKSGREISGSKRGTGLHPDPSILKAPNHHERSRFDYTQP